MKACEGVPTPMRLIRRRQLPSAHKMLRGCGDINLPQCEPRRINLTQRAVGGNKALHAFTAKQVPQLNTRASHI